MVRGFFVKITPLTRKKKLKHTSNDPNTSKKKLKRKKTPVKELFSLLMNLSYKSGHLFILIFDSRYISAANKLIYHMIYLIYVILYLKMLFRFKPKVNTFSKVICL